MDKSPKTRLIDVLIFDDVNILDVAGPVQAFETAQYNNRKIYKHRYVSLDGKPVRASCGLTISADSRLSSNSDADDLLIPGGDGIDRLLGNFSLREIIREKAMCQSDGRLISICSGALVLATAGVLDGQTATTHWSREIDIRKYTDVKWDLDRISVEVGRVFTSAGVTTGIDLAMSIIRADCGNSVALEVARELVVQLRRTGGQSQYAFHVSGQFTNDDRLGHLIELVVAQPGRNWSLDQLANEAGMNSRTLSRRFRKYMSVSPAQFVEQTRVDHARSLLSDNVSLKATASESGFGDLQRMRRAFQKRFGINVGEYVSAFCQKGKP